MRRRIRLLLLGGIRGIEFESGDEEEEEEDGVQRGGALLPLID